LEDEKLAISIANHYKRVSSRHFHLSDHRLTGFFLAVFAGNE